MVDVRCTAPEEVPEVEPQETTEQEMITQTDETVAIKPKNGAEEEKPKEVKKPEKTAAEKAAEAKKLAEEKLKERAAAKSLPNGCQELSVRVHRWKEARELLIAERVWKVVKTEILQRVLKQNRRLWNI